MGLISIMFQVYTIKGRGYFEGFGIVFTVTWSDDIKFNKFR